MTVWVPVPAEQRILFSPAWFVPYDDFRRRPRAGGLVVELDRWDGARWVPTGIAPVRTPSGAIAYPGLGRRREPWAGEPELYRARFDGVGFRALYPADDEQFSADQVGKEFLAYPYDDSNPPQILAQAEPVRLLPSTSFAYPPGVRVVSGVVRLAGSGLPVDNALVEASGRTTLDGVPWRERTLSDATGAFRLPLRWDGERPPLQPPPAPPDPTESFRLTATERPGHTGQVDIRLPADLGRTHVIEIS